MDTDSCRCPSRTWGSTGKEVERSSFWIEVPRIWQRFKLSFIICFLCIAMMVVFTTNVVPFEWQIPGWNWALIIPLSLVVGCHILLPIVLNPWLMIFSYWESHRRWFYIYLYVHPHDCFYYHPLSIIEVFSCTTTPFSRYLDSSAFKPPYIFLHYWATCLYLGTARSSFLGINIGLCDGLAH